MEAAAPSFCPSLYGAELHINRHDAFCLAGVDVPMVIDVETDEKDNFVGFGWTQDGKNVYYSTRLPVHFGDTKLIGHNLKGDLKWFKSWGVKVSSDNLFYDTCLASYVKNTTKESHGLKDLAKEFLGLEWPTYREMVGKGKNKATLDKQEVGRVAAYCGMDCLATFRLYEHFKNTMTWAENKYLEEIELPTARALFDMEISGVNIDIPNLKALNIELESKLTTVSKKIQEMWKGSIELNINSNFQIAELLQSQGAVLPKTQKGNFKVDKQTLNQFSHLPVVPLLLEHSKIEKLKSTYTESLLEKHKEGKIFCSFNQITRSSKGVSVGISTGRLSSSDPNLQNIPARTEEGARIREAFIPSSGRTFIDADFSQIEPRLVAHFSKDPLFIKAFVEERDIYQELVEGTGRSRNDGKTFMLALLYGAQPKKLASVFKCSEYEAEDIIEKIMSKLPGVTGWINRTKYMARMKKGVSTLFGRWVPLPLISSANRFERLHWERVAVNTVIQGSAAEIMKLTLIKLRELNFNSVLTVHDEVLIETDVDSASLVAQECKNIIEGIVKLAVPLKVSVGIGDNWSEAKC